MQSYSAESLAPAAVVPGQPAPLRSAEPAICPAALASLAASLPEFSALSALGALGPDRYAVARAKGVPPVLELGVIRLAPRRPSAAAPEHSKRCHPYVAMHLGGRDLEDERGAPLEGRELAGAAAAALRALRALHATGRVHRDVKPSNFVAARPVEHAARALALQRCRAALDAAAAKEGAAAAAGAGAGAVEQPPAAKAAPAPAPAPDHDRGDDNDDLALAAAAASLPPAPWPFPDVCPAAAAAPLSRPRLYLIDYGFARRLDEEPRDKRGRVLFHGTPDFASLRALQGCPQTAKDDYESLCYVLIQLATGRLPWRLTTNSAAARGWTADELASFARRKVALFERAAAQGAVPPFVEKLLRYLWSLRAEEGADDARVDALVAAAGAWRARPRAPSEDWSSDGAGEEAEEEEELADYDGEAGLLTDEDLGASPRLGRGKVVPATEAEAEEEQEEEEEEEKAPPAPRPLAARRQLPPAPRSSLVGPRASCPPDVPPTAAAARPCRRRRALSAPASRLACAEGELDAAADRVAAAAPVAADAAVEAAALAAELAVAPPIVALHQAREPGDARGAAVVLEQLGDRELLLQEEAEGGAAAAAAEEGPPAAAAAVEDGLLALDDPVAPPPRALGAKRPAPLPPISAAEDGKEEAQAGVETAADGDKENVAVPAADAAVAPPPPPAAKRLRLSEDFGRQRQILLEEADE